ncbi:MAG TPA: pyruvate kinase [Chitinophagaceae bacterium]|nr:pyruvate kinase [Chitinophagaceae bacterium]
MDTSKTHSQKNLSKYVHQDMNHKASRQHSSHKTKVVATVGPACDSYEQLLKLVQTGVNVFRLNFSHGDWDNKKEVIQHIKKINKLEPYNVAILCDLQGPKIRVGKIKDEELDAQPGDKLIFSNENTPGTKENIYIAYHNFHNDVKAGDSIMIDDGKIEVKVLEVTKDNKVVTEVQLGGKILSNKGVNLPDTQISLPSLTEKDKKDLEFILTQDVDWLALSFVRKVKDITELRKKLNAHNSHLKIIAKIEKPEAVENIREIILESDGIMIARGDLGVELPVEQVPMIQKNIIRKCIHRAKPVIVATQMMESMMERSKPNRSEITDVANAVMEGADAVMLSGETAMGKHPALVIETMTKILEEVEKENVIYNRNLTPQSHSPSFLSDALCYNGCRIADDVNADALIGMTQSGYTGFILSSYRPKAPLYVFTKVKTLVNQLSLSWGIRAFYYDEEVSIDDIIEDEQEILKERGFISKGDVVVNTGSMPIEKHLPTNMLKISKMS